MLELFMQFFPVDTCSHENYSEMVSGWGMNGHWHFTCSLSPELAHELVFISIDILSAGYVSKGK